MAANEAVASKAGREGLQLAMPLRKSTEVSSISSSSGDTRPIPGEPPALFAARLATTLQSSERGERTARRGQHGTPVAIAEFMSRLCTAASEHPLRILDPGAGTGVLACALVETLVERRAVIPGIYVEAWERDRNLAVATAEALAHAADWAETQGVEVRWNVAVDDFVMAYAERQDSDGSLGDVSLPTEFDVVIGNPPYYKLRLSDPRVRVVRPFVHGQPNIYAAFMAVSANLLREKGELIFITPRSYMSGPYFRRFRERFLDMMRPVQVHVFESRRDVFKQDGVLQEIVILKARREENWQEGPRKHTVQISSSNGAYDVDLRRIWKSNTDLVVGRSTADSSIRLPISEKEEAIIRLIQSWPNSVRSNGLKVSTGPIVPFRKTELLRAHGDPSGATAPLLWMHHVRPMRVEWPKGSMGKPQFISLEPAARSVLVPDSNYVVMRRFTAKEETRRVVAAPLIAGELGSSWIGLENHLNYIHRLEGELSPLEARGLSLLLNSSLVDRYIRTGNGNTQVSAAEIEALPLPHWDVILELGRLADDSLEPDPDADSILIASLGDDRLEL